MQVILIFGEVFGEVLLSVLTQFRSKCHEIIVESSTIVGISCDAVSVTSQTPCFYSLNGNHERTGQVISVHIVQLKFEEIYVAFDQRYMKIGG